MAIITLERMQFYAYHGCFDEEQTVGANYEISLSMELDVAQASETDNLADTLNYQSVYHVVKKEMAIKSRLIEHVSERIGASVLAQFPQIRQLDLSFSKLNPPLGGQIERVTIARQWFQSQPTPRAASLSPQS
jgi:dihydroneopterin aldolase